MTENNRVIKGPRYRDNRIALAGDLNFFLIRTTSVGNGFSKIRIIGFFIKRF